MTAHESSEEKTWCNTSYKWKSYKLSNKEIKKLDKEKKSALTRGLGEILGQSIPLLDRPAAPLEASPSLSLEML